MLDPTVLSLLTAMQRKHGAFFFFPALVTWTRPTKRSSPGKNNSLCKLCLNAAIFTFRHLVPPLFPGGCLRAPKLNCQNIPRNLRATATSPTAFLCYRRLNISFEIGTFISVWKSSKIIDTKSSSCIRVWIRRYYKAYVPNVGFFLFLYESRSLFLSTCLQN